jgi:hypothetical protein
MSLLLLLHAPVIGPGDAQRTFAAQVWARYWAIATRQRIWSAEDDMIYSEPKAPASVEDFRLDWSAALGADTITTSVWALGSSASSTGLFLVAQGHTATTATVRVGGGIVGRSYVVTNTVTLGSGQVKTQSITIPIADA